MNKEELIEKLSSIEHDRWCNWQKYLHSCCIKNQDGSLTIPKKYVEHWEYEINTKYENLPDNIKESDRKEVYKIIPIIEEYLQHQLEEKDKVIDEVIDYIKIKLYHTIPLDRMRLEILNDALINVLGMLARVKRLK